MPGTVRSVLPSPPEPALPAEPSSVGGRSAFELELDLECFCGPFDLLLALVLRDEVDLVEVPVATICLRYLERLDAAGELDPEAASEFLVLVAALVELKARLLLPGEQVVDDVSPEEAAEELAARLAEYARVRAGAAWLRERREELGRRVFRLGPAPLAPRRPVAVKPRAEDPDRLRVAVERLLEPAPRLELSHLPRRILPVRTLIDRFRGLLAERGTFVFDEEVARLDRMAQAVAFWAVLELYRRGEVRVAQAEAFAPIRVVRSRGLRQPRDGALAATVDHAFDEAVA